MWDELVVKAVEKSFVGFTLSNSSPAPDFLNCDRPNLLKNEAPQPVNSSPYKKIKVTPGPWKIARSVAVSRDGQIIVSGDDDGEVQLWSPDTGKLIRTLSAHSNWVQSIAISPDDVSVFQKFFRLAVNGNH